MEKIYIILGPTSSGKTSLALDLCKKYDGEIVSADSRQVYQEMDIGTGKKPAGKKFSIKKQKNRWLVDGTNVWGYDLVRPDEYFSSFNFAEFALQKIRELQKQDKKTFLVGGTGFYIDMTTGRVKPSKVKPDFELREELETLGLEKLQEKLKDINPKEYEKIDQNNPARLIRALEKSLSKKTREKPLNYLQNIEFVHLGLTAKRDTLYQRADTWLEKIWNNGLIPETKALIRKYPNSDKLQGLVYRTVIEYLDKKHTETKAKERIKFDLHAYIRRQQTYFKKIPNVNWLDLTQDNLKQIVYNIVNG